MSESGQKNAALKPLLVKMPPSLIDAIDAVVVEGESRSSTIRQLVRLGLHHHAAR